MRAIDKAVGNPALAEEGLVAELAFDDEIRRALRLRVQFTRGKAQPGSQ